MYSNAYSGTNKQNSMFNHVFGLLCSDGIKATITKASDRFLFQFKINMLNKNFHSKLNYTSSPSENKIIINNYDLGEAVITFVNQFKEFIPVQINLTKEQYDLYTELKSNKSITDLIYTRPGCLGIVYDGGAPWK